MAGEDDELFGGNVAEELQKWIHVLLFHIPVFIFSFTMYICCACSVALHLYFYFYFSPFFSSFKYNIFYVFCLLLQWNNYTFLSFFYMSMFILTFLHVHCIFDIGTLEETGLLDKKMNCFVQQ
jgi:hypothetical protein